MKRIKNWFNKYDWGILKAIAMILLDVVLIAAMGCLIGYLFYRWFFWGTLF